jgi:hypothetical protein
MSDPNENANNSNTNTPNKNPDASNPNANNPNANNPEGENLETISEVRQETQESSSQAGEQGQQAAKPGANPERPKKHSKKKEKRPKAPILHKDYKEYLDDQVRLYYRMVRFALNVAKGHKRQARFFIHPRVDLDLEHLRYLRAGVKLVVDLDGVLRLINIHDAHTMPEPVKFALLLNSSELTHLLAAGRPDDFLHKGSYERNLKTLKSRLDAYSEDLDRDAKENFEQAYPFTVALLNATALGISYNEEMYTWVMRQALRNAKVKVTL